MIQVCSRCTTRWNVRDRQRQWCPRCNGALLPPTGAEPSAPFGEPTSRARQAATRPHPQAASAARRGGALLPPGYRWIAVRPGAAPPPRRRHRELGPPPRYAFIPRWGLVDPATLSPAVPESAPPRQGPSAWAVRATLVTTIAVLGVAALLHIARYGLLIVNRDMLLNSIVAGVATWVAVAASVGAIFAVVGTAFVLMEWLIARRATAFAHRWQPDPRPLWVMRAGCLVPLANVFWALTFVVELATVENRYRHLRRLIWSWWALFVFSTAVSIYASVTCFPSDTQGIADNTLSFVVAYLLAMAAVLTLARVVLAFERTPVERPARRWLAVAATTDPVPELKDDIAAPAAAESQAAVERAGQEPAA